MQYPKYKRHEKLNAKLSEEDIELMVLQRQNGLYYKEIAQLHNVSASCAWMVINGYKNPNKQIQDTEYRNEIKRKSKARKAKEMQQDIKKYNHEIYKKYYNSLT